MDDSKIFPSSSDSLKINDFVDFMGDKLTEGTAE